MSEERCAKCEHLKALHIPGTGCTEDGCNCTRAGLPGDLYNDESGRRFKPGNPGPPTGNLRKIPSIKRLLKRLADEEEDALYNAVKKLALTIDDAKVQAQFLRFVTEQLDGRAVESIRLTGAEDGPIQTYDLSKLPAADLRQVLGLLRGASRDAANDDAQDGQ